MCSLIFGLYMILLFYTRIDDVDDHVIVCTPDTFLSYSDFSIIDLMSHSYLYGFCGLISAYSHLSIITQLGMCILEYKGILDHACCHFDLI